MGRIVISENVSLDGVVQDPTGEEGHPSGGWFTQVGAADRAAWAELALEEAKAATALLLGGRSYVWFAERWTSRTGEWADRLNRMAKYVVSSTLTQPAWANTTVLDGSALGAVTALRQEVDGDVVVYGSATLVHTLMEHDLADELRLTVYPFVLGEGVRLFDQTPSRRRLHLAEVQTLGDDLTHLTYRTVRTN